jgi:hypothetical protein
MQGAIDEVQGILPINSVLYFSRIKGREGKSVLARGFQHFNFAIPKLNTGKLYNNNVAHSDPFSIGT